ncbi:MAG: hypothetical protein R3F21_02760 [Myxococcota bacterium]
METILASVALIGIVMAGMAVGVIFSNRKLRGSCGRECECAEETRRECALAAAAEGAAGRSKGPGAD